MLNIIDVACGYKGNVVLCDVSLEIPKGSLFTILGPNGSGKTTLIRSITGEIPLIEGKVLVNGENIARWSVKQRAKKIAVLAQNYSLSLDLSVEEIVMLGRYPFQNSIFNIESDVDKGIVLESMKLTDVYKFRDTQFSELSGGEKQRVLLAKTIAQQPEILILDEPTNHLDLKHSHDLLELLKTWQQSHNLTIVAIMHDLNLAALYSDQVALLYDGTIRKVGDVNILREEGLIKEVYGIEMSAITHPITNAPQLLLNPKYS